MSALRAEADRQQALLQAIARGAIDGLQAQLAGPSAQAAAGLAVYRANLQANIERALVAAYPTVREVIGERACTRLLRDYLAAEPPRCGDLAQYGDGLAAFIAGCDAMAGEPYLPDLARLEWAVHCASAAADAAPVEGLSLLGEADPAELTLHYTPGFAVIPSPHPIVSIWQAHRAPHGDGTDRYADVRQAFAEQRAEGAIVLRSGWRVGVHAVSEATAAFTAALHGGASLAAALERVRDVDFESWLLRALRERWLAAVTR